MDSFNPARLGEKDDHWLWPEYYQAFPAFSSETVRDGCHPRKMLHASGADQAVVLVHGLTDSPYFMSAIGEYFYGALGWDVYIPLLQCHGLKSPEGMGGVALDQWLLNVGFAVRAAGQRAAKISIGGFSMGGALGYFFACTDQRITGDLFLFSAAFGLPSGPCGIPGWFKEWLLRLPLVTRLDRTFPLIGNNPYRYRRISLNSAAELARLLEKINTLPRQFTDTGNPARRIFAVWSECDNVIGLDKLRELQQRTPEKRFVPFILPTSDHVDHACVVLQNPIHALRAEPGAVPLELANPRFIEMLAAISRFADAD